MPQDRQAAGGFWHYRRFDVKVLALLLSLAPLGFAVPAVAVSVSVPPAAGRPAELRLIADAQNEAHGVGKVNTVDPAKHKVNLTHKPIAALQWPAMTMDFAVAPSVDLKDLQPGAQVDFTLQKIPAGGFEIQSIKPVSAK
jgi:Cu/Ag efflux protein CusF